MEKGVITQQNLRRMQHFCRSVRDSGPRGNNDAAVVFHHGRDLQFHVCVSSEAAPLSSRLLRHYEKHTSKRHVTPH